MRDLKKGHVPLPKANHQRTKYFVMAEYENIITSAKMIHHITHAELNIPKYKIPLYLYIDLRLQPFEQCVFM